MNHRPLVSAASLVVLVACGPSSSGPETGTGSGTTSSSVTTSGGGGSSSTSGAGGSSSCEDDLCLDAPASGFQLRTDGDEIQPGEDIEYCEVVALPGGPEDEYYVSGYEIAMTPFSHHLIVVAAVPGSDTEKAISPGMKKTCYGADAFGGDVYGVTGSQKPTHEETYPDGVGKKFKGGQKLVFDYHYFNSSPKPVKARAAVNFNTVEAAKVTREAHSFGFYNLNLSIPPMSKKSFSGECRFKHDVMVSKLTRHTHQWGKDFSVYHAGGAKDGEHVWTTPNYEETDFIYDEPILVKGGDGFRFTCAFDNTTAKTLKFGLTASDEMCILFGTWFTPTVGASEDNQDCLTD
ncbi:MAG: hypothetical protein FJ096_14350 [Deltaproteobacteria bacterium]|nr:hypothetical protein [Deltaproteobacteria bacterium]